jgi:hypothetical protein
MYAHTNSPLNFPQVDAHDDSIDSSDGFTTLTSREEIEYHIMDQNRRQSLQSLCTPFMQIEEL